MENCHFPEFCLATLVPIAVLWVEYTCPRVLFSDARQRSTSFTLLVRNKVPNIETARDDKDYPCHFGLLSDKDTSR